MECKHTTHTHNILLALSCAPNVVIAILHSSRAMRVHVIFHIHTSIHTGTHTHTTHTNTSAWGATVQPHMRQCDATRNSDRRSDPPPPSAVPDDDDDDYADDFEQDEKDGGLRGGYLLCIFHSICPHLSYGVPATGSCVRIISFTCVCM